MSWPPGWCSSLRTVHPQASNRGPPGAGRRLHVVGMNPKLRVIAAARCGWFTRMDAMTAGYSVDEVRRRLRSGQWSRLSRDAYVESDSWPPDEQPWERARRLHLLSMRAVMSRMSPGVVVSHQSAAVLHGLPPWGLDLSRVQVSRTTGRARSDTVVNVHRSPIGADEITEVDGIRVVTPARAITEAACVSSYEVGVVLADGALHQRLVTPDLLVATADRHKYWNGSAAARAAARFADGLSESVGESRLRVLMANAGLPAPALQVEIRDQDNRLIGRVDFLLLKRLIVEFDGVQKYGADPEAVLAEKWREDGLRACGYRVVRTSWADLDRPRATAERIRARLEA
jgi:very-short-patch-repair endonuclease